MFRPASYLQFGGCFSSFFLLILSLLLGFVSLTNRLCAEKISPNVIIASIEGEVSSLNMVDDFKVEMGPSSVGKRVLPKTILSTGKTGKISLLFSNGTLITIKPGSRFYLRTYKQLEGIVEGVVDPGKLQEEPTQSELSGHLDYGDLVVKAPKLKKGSSMKLTSPLGTAGIRGTMFQLMAVRNSVTGDIMGGINLISGDIDFTDTGGKVVTLLSGQSIQLATSKLGEPVASMTGELVDLTSTYGPALTDGFTPPTPEIIFPNLTQSSSSDDDSDSENDPFNEPNQATVASSGLNFEFIHGLATDLFFEIEEAEKSSSEFSFESMAIATTVDVPTPQAEAPVVPASIKGETLAGGDLEFFQGGHPELKLLEENKLPGLVKIFDNGARMEVEMLADSDGKNWRKIDPWVQAFDFLGNDITAGVQLSGAPQIVLTNSQDAETEAPPPGIKVNYEVSYTIRDLRGLSTVVFRSVDVLATRPNINVSTIPSELKVPMADPAGTEFSSLTNQIQVTDVLGKTLEYTDSSVAENKLVDCFYLNPAPDFTPRGESNDIRKFDFELIAVDWRGLRSSYPISFSVSESPPVLNLSDFASNFPSILGSTNKVEFTDPDNELNQWANTANGLGWSSGSFSKELDIEKSVLSSSLTFSQIANEPGNYVVQFEVVDPRVAQNPEWKEFLTTSIEKTLEVVTTLPSIEYDPIPDVPYRLADPESKFQQWVDKISVIDASGSSLALVQEETDRNNTPDGYFYFFPSYPDVNNKGQSDFKIIAVDWRGVETRSESIVFEVEADPPTVTNDPSFLEPEMSEMRLMEVDHNITAQDEFQNNNEFGDLSIILTEVRDSEGNDVPLTTETRLLDLKNETYTLEYNITDFRGESILVERSLRAKVTSPELSVPRFSSQYASNEADFSEVKNLQELEFSDPLEEWQNWISKIQAIDYLDNNISSDISVTFGDSTVILGTGEVTYPEEVGEHIYKFTVVDPRFESLTYPEEWVEDMTIVASQTITLIKTLPIYAYQNDQNEKEFELEDTPLNQIDHGISLKDLDGNEQSKFLEVGGTISLIDVRDTSGNPLEDFNQSSLLNLKNEKYLFTYQISDYRDVSTNVEIYVVPISTPPVLEISDLVNSEQDWLSDSNNTLEYGVLSPQYLIWLESAIAEQISSSPLVPSVSIISSKDESGVSQSIPSDVYQLPKSLGEHVVRFRVEDERFSRVTYQEEWDAPLSGSSLTTEKDFVIKVVSTKPEITVFYHDERSGLSADEEEIKYLVDLKYPVYESKYASVYPEEFIKYSGFSDGFDIVNGVADELESGKLYYTSQAFNGEDLSGEVIVDASSVDTSVLSENPIEIKLFIDDSTQRNLLSESDGLSRVTLEITPAVSVVDILPPILELINHPSYLPGISDSEPMVIEGIMEEITLVNGSKKDQVSSSSGESLNNYFPDPGLEIFDNYYSQDEIAGRYGIPVAPYSKPSYTFEYFYEPETLEFTNVWEFSSSSPDGSGVINYSNPVEMAVAGKYEIIYQLSDSSNNLSEKLTRYVQVSDTREPVVKLYGASTVNVDLKSIEDGESRYSDNGAFAIENLYVEGTGLFDWTSDHEVLQWKITTEECNDLENDTYNEQAFTRIKDDEYIDFIADRINSYLQPGSSLPQVSERFRVTYELTDISGNSASVQKIVELRGENSIYPYIWFPILEGGTNNGVPNSNNINLDDKTATLPYLILDIESGGNAENDQLTSAPVPTAWNELGDGSRDYFADEEISTELLFLDENNEIKSNPPYIYTGTINNYLSSAKVNFWKNEGEEFYYEYDQTNDAYLPKIGTNSGNWRRVVIRYTAKNVLDSGSIASSIRDIEIRIRDETGPDIVQNSAPWGSNFIEVGNPEVDPADSSQRMKEIISDKLVEITDDAGSDFTTTISINPKPTGLDDNATIDELDERGFWTADNFVISYTAVDEFENSSTYEYEGIQTRDRTAPHVIPISHNAIEGLFSGNDFSGLSETNTIQFSPGLPEGVVHPFTIFDGEDYPNSNQILNKFQPSSSIFSDWITGGSLQKALPFLRKDEDGMGFVFNASEIDLSSLESLNEETIPLEDKFGRSYVWYSPITIEFSEENPDFQDPGMLIYESSNDDLTISSTITPDYHEFGDSQQIKSLKVETEVKQANGLSTTVERTYSFLDDIKPTIFLDEDPKSDGESTFILVEAGQAYSDFNGTYYYWTVSDSVGSKGDIVNRSVTIQDTVDGDNQEDYNITRTYIDVASNTNSTNPDAIINEYSLDSIYKIRYDVKDSQGNEAEPVFRWLIVKDTIAPVFNITGSTDLTFASTSQSNPDSSDINSVKEFMLSGLSIYDKYENSINAQPPIDDYVDAGSTPWEFNSTSDIWNISIEKLNDANGNDPYNGDPYQAGAVYPTGPESETYGNGYKVEISISDSSGNTSDILSRRLKVGDYDAPVITLIGKSLIHDFFRYGENNNTSPANQNLYSDQPESTQYDSTGFSGGAHRLILSDYNFVDPGAYAEDGNLTEYQGFFNTAQGFPDFDGDGIGEGHAIQQVTDINKMLNPADPGIIYAYRSSQKTTRELQEILQENSIPADLNDSAFLPDVEGQGYDFNTTNKASTDAEKITIDIIEITIQYNVKDGWGNEPDEPYVRRVYIYESRQFANFAFYATPLREYSTLEDFASLYNNSNSSQPYLTSAEKDLDGDGVSDFWEVALGFAPDNASESPDMTDPAVFSNLSNQDLSTRLIKLEDYQDIQWDASHTPVTNLEFEALKK